MGSFTAVILMSLLRCFLMRMVVNTDFSCKLLKSHLNFSQGEADIEIHMVEFDRTDNIFF